MQAHAVSDRVRTTLAMALVAVAALLLLTALTQGAEAKAKAKAKSHAKVTKGPKGLKFYKPPKKLPKQHGALIWARKATGSAKLADARSTNLVLYSSRTPQGAKAAVSGTVSVPKGKVPKGGWPVITWAHGTTGVADACAPSRDSATSPAHLAISYIYPDLNEWLRAGYAVVQTDYQGLGTPGKHPYLIGEAEGRSVLDIVTAARQLDPNISKRYLISGHSQGGQSALFAAGEASSWAPKLRLRGTVAFAPASHILEQVPLLSALTSPSPLTALATMILDGASTQSSAIDPNKLLSDEVLAQYPLLQTQCLEQLATPSELGGIPPSHLIRSGADLSPVNPVLAAMNPLVRSNAPMQIEQGEADTTVFKTFTDQLKDELVNAGNQLTYKTYPGVDHVGVVSAGDADALAFFRQMLPPRR
ncbi:MAG TPA: lipase family protein [Solirubrobacterales bacterium]